MVVVGMEEDDTTNVQFWEKVTKFNGYSLNLSF